ncbi:MAG: S-layer homology domain-containing protein [bacterium]
MKLRRIMMAAMMVIALAAVSAHAATEIKDVDESSWAYKSIKKLVDKGYLAIYEDNTFRGENALSRTVFAAALAKLIDQIERGDLKIAGSDRDVIKKLSDEFKSEMADYDSKMGAIEKRVSDIESGKVVIQTDISKVTVEFRDRLDKVDATTAKLRDDITMLNSDLQKVNEDLQKERADRKKAQSTMWLGIGLAAILGVAVN